MPQVRWRVAVTRDDGADRRLAVALELEGFDVVECPVLEEAPPASVTRLEAAARSLEQFDWIVFSSVRAVHALVNMRPSAWPRGVRTAAVGSQTAEALARAGADPQPVSADAPGAEPLWDLLASLDQWTGRRVLVPTTPGGRRLLIDRLRAAGASVEEVEAYQILPRADHVIRACWESGAPQAAIIASPSAAEILARAVGVAGLRALQAVVAIGPTTAASLSALGVPHSQAPRADFTAAAAYLASLLHRR